MGNRDDEPSGILLTTDPAVTTEISITTEYDYKLNLVRIPFVSSGVGRSVALRITVDGSIIYDVPVDTTIGAVTAEILYGENLPYTSVGNTRMVPLPHNLRIPRGAVIETVTGSLGGTDNFGAAVLFVDKLT